MNADPLAPGGAPAPAQLSVLIPVHEGAANLPALLRELLPVLSRLEPAHEVLLVDDGSKDGSWAAISTLGRQHPRVRGLRLARNFGQHNALLCAARAARGVVCVTMDDDLQHPPAEIERLVAPLAAGVDVVYGAPRREQREPARRLASRLTKWALRHAMGVEAAEHVSAFRAFRTSLRDGFENFSAPYVSFDVLLSWAARAYQVVEVDHRPSALPESRYSLRRLVDHTFNVLSGFSAAPLRLASGLGFALTLFGFVVLAWVVGRTLVTGTSVPGFPFLASIIAIFSGAQLFTLGIVGEYMARLFLHSLGKPPYVVVEATPETGAR